MRRRKKQNDVEGSGSSNQTEGDVINGMGNQEEEIVDFLFFSF